MFRWFKQMEQPSSEAHEWMVAQFRRHREEIENASPEVRMAVAQELAGYWRGFITKYESSTAFGQLPRERQLQFFKNVASLRADFVKQNDLKRAMPLEIFGIYLSAIINGRDAMEKEAARFLEEQSEKVGGHLLK